MRTMRRCAGWFLLALLLIYAPVEAAPGLQQRVAALWERADAQLAASHDCDALATARRAVRIAPRNADAWALLSWVYFESQLDFTTMDVVDMANRAARLRWDSPRVRFAWGVAVCFCGPDTNLGMEALRDSLRVAPNYAQAHAMLALALWDDQKPTAAIAEMREAIRLQPTRSRWHAELAGMLGQGSFLDEALAESQKAIRSATDNWQLARAHRERAWLLAYRQQGAEALSEARLASALTPRESQAMADSCGANRALDNPPLMSAQAAYGAITALFGDPRKAETILRDLWSDDVAGPARAYALALQDKPEDTTRELAREWGETWRTSPQSPWHIHFIAKTYEAVGDIARASAACAIALKTWPSHPWSAEWRTYLSQHPASQ